MRLPVLAHKAFFDCYWREERTAVARDMETPEDTGTPQSIEDTVNKVWRGIALRMLDKEQHAMAITDAKCLIDSLNLPLSTQALIDRFLAEQIWKINASYPDTEHDLVVFSDNEFALYSMATALIYSWQMKSSDRESHIAFVAKRIQTAR